MRQVKKLKTSSQNRRPISSTYHRAATAHQRKRQYKLTRPASNQPRHLYHQSFPSRIGAGSSPKSTSQSISCVPAVKTQSCLRGQQQKGTSISIALQLLHQAPPCSCTNDQKTAQALVIMQKRLGTSAHASTTTAHSKAFFPQQARSACATP